MDSTKKYISGLPGVLLLLLFIGYYSSMAMYYHAHLVNGHILGHSHPYKYDKSNKTPYESHSHSSSAYYVIQHINKTIWKDTSVIVVLPKPAILNFEYCKVYLSPPNKLKQLFPCPATRPSCKLLIYNSKIMIRNNNL